MRRVISSYTTKVLEWTIVIDFFRQEKYYGLAHPVIVRVL